MSFPSDVGEVSVHVIERGLYLGVLEGCARRDALQHARQMADRDERRQITFQYRVSGIEVCSTVFTYCYDKTKWQLTLLQLMIREEAVLPREHGGLGRRPNTAYPEEVSETAVRFIKNFAGVHGLPQPAARRSRPDDPPVYLPAHQNYKLVHAKYFDEMTGKQDCLGYHAFCKLWRRECTAIKFMSPREDVCHVCEEMRGNVRIAKSETEKEGALKAFSDHLESAQVERDAYREAIKSAKEAWQVSQENDEKESPHLMHYTFDFAQSVYLPYSFRQVGPIYFKSPLKVHIFGICDDALSRQVNYLLHEGQTIGIDGTVAHGPNSVVSMLDHFLQHHGHGEEELHFHADNCVRQNKNKTVMAYLSWRTSTGQNSKITISFMNVGHTRCSVDGMFGLLKKGYRRSECDTYEHLVDTVNSSSKGNVTEPYCYKWREWYLHLQAFFKPIPHVTHYHHFLFSKEHPGYVFVRKTAESDETKVKIPKRGDL